MTKTTFGTRNWTFNLVYSFQGVQHSFFVANAVFFFSLYFREEEKKRGDGALVTAIERTQFSVGEFRGDAAQER